MYIYNGKHVGEPKMVDTTHYKFAGKVHAITGPLGEIPSDAQIARAIHMLIFGEYPQPVIISKCEERIITNEIQQQAHERKLSTFRQRSYYHALAGIPMRELIGIPRDKMAELIEDAVAGVKENA
jgi:hypothetical protein